MAFTGENIVVCLLFLCSTAVHMGEVTLWSVERLRWGSGWSGGGMECEGSAWVRVRPSAGAGLLD